MSSQLIERVLELTNEERAKSGLEPLKLNTKLANAADDHSDSMAEDDFFSHTGADGSSVSDRVRSNGYEYSTVGENIAAGQTTAEAVVQAWMDSPGHRANILNADYTEIGIGYEFLENDTGSVNYNHYWTQVFGTSLNGDTADNTEDNSEANLDNLEVEETPITKRTTDKDNPDPEIESEVPDTVKENDLVVDDLADNNGNDLDEIETEIPVESNDEADLDVVQLEDMEAEESTDNSETLDWQFNDSTMSEDSNVDNVTGNSDNSVLAGGDDFKFAENNQSMETSELDSGNGNQFDDLLANSWLGSLIENIENYEEIAMADGDYTSFNNRQYFMQEYQLADV